MILDETRFPLVFMRAHEKAGADINEHFERLLDKQIPFVLITDHSPDDHADETPAERKEKALFFKRVKVRFRKYCRGMIVIEGDKPTSMAARVAAVAASKAFGFSVQFVADEDQAISKGMLLLGHAVA